MSEAKTTAERQREYRARKKAEQLTEVRGIFAHQDDHEMVKEAAAKVSRKRDRERQKKERP